MLNILEHFDMAKLDEATARGDRPKPLVSVAGRTLIEHALEQASAAGVEEAVIVLGNAADQMRALYHPAVIARRHLEIYREVLSTCSKMDLSRRATSIQAIGFGGNFRLGAVS